MEFLEQTFYYNTILNWLISAILILVAVVLAKILFWIINKLVKKATAKTKSILDDLLVDMLEEPVVFGLGILGFWFAFGRLEFPETFVSLIDKAFLFLLANSSQ